MINVTGCPRILSSQHHLIRGASMKNPRHMPRPPPVVVPTAAGNAEALGEQAVAEAPVRLAVAPLLQFSMSTR